ncbi:Anaerobic sulfatase-maturating enzyme [Candidatus Nitrosocosmicus oleophilus]|uniref:Anaerobic sulfatase-maturating enzyme n=2 Tax=Candidatus Nitrosocosmicus oleophilus TaxID=1353260 RepID=A0A654LZ87_9ARCH|nr:Anaerobic sulfatase-maturating enzyme [Candidatus Nitrosocosmicus oleophilus]
MTAEVASQAALNIARYCNSNSIKKIGIVFHGGEPLLGGADYLAKIISTLENVFHKYAVKFYISIQSNGLLFSPEIGDLLLRKNVTLSISLDGPPVINDKNRIDHFGNPSTNLLESKLHILTSSKYRKIFGGFLCVINIESNPILVLEYLLSYEPASIDFLLPDNNHDYLPLGMKNNNTIYADWLIEIFDYWFSHKTKTNVRMFDVLIRSVLGQRSTMDSFGLTPMEFVVIETNGDIEGLDVLKTTYSGAARLGYNVFENTLDQVSSHAIIKLMQRGFESLCAECRECSIVDICGGGYLPHRYSTKSEFDNPSVYCNDLMKLIVHIKNKVFSEIKGSNLNEKLFNHK